MTLSIFDRFITQVGSGIAVPLAELTVNMTGASTGLATLWLDRAGTIPAGNPVTADANGRIQFYAEPARYNMSASFGGDTVTYPNVLIGAEDAAGIPLTIDGATINVSAYLNDDFRYSDSDQNIMYHGALPDTSDSKAAITAAAATGKTIHIPRGSFRSTFTSRIKYQGLGRMYEMDGTTPASNFIKIGQGDTEKDSAPVACIIRQDTASGGWYFINDSGHEPNGFSSVATVSNRIVLDLKTTAIKIQSVVLNPDTTYCKQGITAGIFVSTSQVFIELYKAFFVNVNNTAGSGEWSSYFGTEPTVTKNSDGTITVTHPAVTATSQAPILSNVAISSVSGQVPILRSFTTTSFTYGMYSAIGGAMSYSTGAWVVTTAASDIPTITTDGGDGFLINHQTVRQTGFSVSAGGASPYVVSSSVVSPNITRVVFRDFSGTIVNIPATNMTLVYSGSDVVLQKVPYGNVMARRDEARINPDLLFSPLGNFWIYGGFQV